MSNILFALYHDFTANSAVHVHNFANQLAQLGHAVCVAVPHEKQTAANLGERAYTTANFSECDGNWEPMFANGESPGIVHAWTPRENVRLFCDKLAGLSSFALFVHLEDNEELILEANLGRPFAELEGSRAIETPNNLSHPQNYRRFLREADGISIIMDRLEKFVPPDTPRLILWPGADRTLFGREEETAKRRAALGIPSENVVLCYTGNVHSANAREVRSLYVAVAMLNREGVPATLVRAGKDFCKFLGPDETWAREVSVDLGYLNHPEIPGVLALADFLVQPGTDDAFNEYRLPAKLPEFFAMGKPIILPRTNAGRFVRDGEEAIVLPKVDALAIVESVKQLRSDQALARRLAQGALRFCA